MEWASNITELDQAGTFRSLNGAADENIFIGKASKAGFFCFFKVWRDMPYDAVVDYEGTLYRVEVKGASGKGFAVTRGTRSGKQIKQGTSRTRLITREDCDFVIGVDSKTGDCYIIPEDIISVIGNNSLSKNAVSVFKEKWKLLMHGADKLTPEQTRDGLKSMELEEKRKFLQHIHGDLPTGDPLKIVGTRKKLTDEGEQLIYLIWRKLAELS